MLVHAVGHEELRIFGPSIVAFAEADLLIAERLAMSRGGVLFVRRAVADVAVQDDERGPAFLFAEYLEGVLDAVDVIRVADPQDVPPITDEAGFDILREGDFRAPLDGDVVVVVDPAEVVETKVAGQRGSLRADALHHVSIATNGVNVVIENLEAGPVETVGEPFLADRHTYAGCDALAERAGGGFDARNPVVFGMTGRLAAQLAEVADIVEAYRGASQNLVVRIHCLRLRQVKDRPEQH